MELMADGVISLDDRPAVQAVDRANTALESHDKKTRTVLDRAGKEWQVYGDAVVRVSDRSQTSVNRLISSLEKESSLYGKTGVEKLIVQRDQLITRYSKEQAAVDAITKSYGKMIEAQQKLEQGEKIRLAAEAKGERLRGAGEGLAGFVESPVAAVKGLVASAAESLGPLGIALTATVGVLTAVAGAGFEAAKSLGEYGVQIRDVELRTGLSSKEVAQFGFAARAVGQDVSIFERMMRGLTTALEDQSSKGEKARETLQKLTGGVRDIRGELLPTSEILSLLSEGFQKLPNNFERNKAAMDIFKRAGIEAIPVLQELTENIKIAKEAGFGPEESDVRRWGEYKRNITEVETNWEALKRAIKEPLAASVIFTFKAVGDFLKGAGLSGPRESGVAELAAKQSKEDDERQRVYDAGGEKALSAAAARLNKDISSGLEGQQSKLSKLKQKYDEARTAAEGLAQSGKLMPDIAESHRVKVDAARIAYERQRDAVKEIEKDESRRIASLEKARDLIREGQSFYRIGPGQRAEQFVTGLEMASANKFPTGEEREEAAREHYGWWGRGITLARHGEIIPQEAIRLANIPPPTQEHPEGLQVIRDRGADSVAFVSPEASRAATDSATAARAKARQAGDIQEATQLQQVRLSGLNAETEKTVRLLELRSKPGGEIDLANTVSSIRQSALNEEFRITGEIARYAEASLNNRIELQVKLAEIQERQEESIKRDAEGLFHTLFTKPSEFGKQLRDTLKEAVLKPITEGLSDRVASVIHPVIYGKDGQSGIAGTLHRIFGGIEKIDPIKISNDLNTAATDRNTQALDRLSASRGGGGGGSTPELGFRNAGNWLAPYIQKIAPTLALAGALSAAPAMRAPGVAFLPQFVQQAIQQSMGAAGARSTGTAVDASVNYGGTDYGASSERFGWTNPASGIGPGGTAGFSPGSLGISGGSGGGFNLGGIFGGGGSPGSSGGWQGILGNLKGMGSNLGGLIGYKGAGQWDTSSATGSLGKGGSEGQGIGGAAKGIAGSDLVAGLGMGLAMKGLTGKDAGTWGGIAEGTAGGAMVGFKYGGPLGAAIGAAVGFSIGLGEKLAGVESPEREAIRLVKSMYGVTVDMKMATQIAQLAKQKYAGHVSIAVRDPDVRKMLELYSAGTGQNMPQSNTEPRAGSLVEQGGSLYQGASYQFGKSYSFGSNLPTLGGPTAGTWNAGPSSSPTYVSLNFDGRNAGDAMTGQFVTPELVAGHFASSQSASMGRMQNAALMQQPGLQVG
jgi:hypothetical protein